MQKDNITPEEKLLKIIENPAAHTEKVALKSAAKTTAIKQVTGLPKIKFFDKNTFKSLTLHKANKIIIVCSTAITLILVLNFVSAQNGLSLSFKGLLKPQTSSHVAENKIVLPPVNPDDLVALSKKRNMFSFLAPAAKKASAEAQEVTKKISNLKLVGVIWSENPQVMIENSEDLRTYLLNADESIGQIKIKKILRDKAILEVDGQEVELR